MPIWACTKIENIYIYIYPSQGSVQECIWFYLYIPRTIYNTTPLNNSKINIQGVNNYISCACPHIPKSSREKISYMYSVLTSFSSRDVESASVLAMCPDHFCVDWIMAKKYQNLLSSASCPDTTTHLKMCMTATEYIRLRKWRNMLIDFSAVFLGSLCQQLRGSGLRVQHTGVPPRSHQCWRLCFWNQSDMIQ